TQPQHGTLTGTAPALTYAPARDWNGTDSFTWRAATGSHASPAATVGIVVTPVDDAPVASDATLTTAEEQPLAVHVTATDVEHDAITFAVTTAPQHGTLSGTLPDVTYTPAPLFHGTDAFAVTPSDAGATGAPATITIVVTHVNHAPTAKPQ